MWLRLLVVFLVFLVNAFAASYKGIRVGQNIADLPEQIRCEAVYCEGKYKGDWIRVSELGGKVLMFDVVYVGTSLDKEITISRALPLAKAIRLRARSAEAAEACFDDAGLVVFRALARGKARKAFTATGP